MVVTLYVDARPFDGVKSLFNQDANTAYGEITPNDLLREDGTTSMWKAGYVSTAQTMSFQTMQAIRRLASVGNSDAEKPDLYITTEVLKDAFEATLQAQVVRSDGNRADAGFDNVLFKGAALTFR